MVDWLETREEILPFFENQDLILDVKDTTDIHNEPVSVVYVRPSEQFCRNPDLNYLIKLIFDDRGICIFVAKAQKIYFKNPNEKALIGWSPAGDVECYGETTIGTLAKSIILSILSDYDNACKKYVKYYKNRKIAEIKGICDKYTV